MKKALIYFFIFNLVFLLLIILTPLEFCELKFTLIDFWFTIILGLFLFFKFNSNKDTRKTVRITSFIVIPFLSLISAYILFVETGGAIKTYSIPKTNKVIVTRFYTLFMMGNPRNDMSTGYTFFGDFLVWRTGKTYIKDGMGDNVDEIKKYQLPDSLYDRESVFILKDQGYIVDDYYEKVYKLVKK